jgi:dihydroorotate dehydrogenase (fumarate)
MDLSTRYLGLDLPHPMVPSAAQPLTKDLDSVKRLEDGGAAAVVIHSLFEEQISMEAANLDHFLEHGSESFAEALTYYPPQKDYVLGPHEYLEHIRAAKEALSVPIIGSLNGVSVGGWIKYANLIEKAGADALELNVYYLPTNPELSGEEIENVYVSVLAEVKKNVSIPVAMKFGSYFSNVANFAMKLVAAGADGLTMFNRYYQPDIDIVGLEMSPQLSLSTSAAVHERVRWIGIVRPLTEITISATGGNHTVEDAMKVIMAGADVVNMCSALLMDSPAKLGATRDGIAAWLVEHEYESLAQARGSMSQESCPEPAAYERANYMKLVHKYLD